MTYRKFKSLYYHYQNYYDFTLRKLTYKEVEERVNEEEEWLR